MSNTVDSNFGKLILMTELATYHWIEEINSQGSKFDYNSQDIFREHLKLAHSFNYKESIDLHKKSDFRNLVFDVFPEKLEDNIKIYENYKNFFDGFDRNKLMLETYRKVKKSSLTDSELNLEISSIVELMERDDYYKSDFYKDFGFLSINFHLYIYIFNKKMLSDLRSEFKNYKPYNPNYLKTNKIPFFSMKLISEIFVVCNGVIFEPVYEFDYYKEFNFFHSFNKLKIIGGQNNKIYYLIDKMYKTIELQRREDWLEGILINFNFMEKTYRSKYKEVTNSDSNDSTRDFVEEIDAIFK